MSADRSTPPIVVGALLAVVLMAGLVRLPGIGHDLPGLYTHDEVSTVETALRFGTGSLRPYSFGHGPLMSYVVAVAFGGYYAGLRVTGTVARPEEFVQRYLHDPTPFYLINRGLAIALSLGLVVLVYGVGRRLFNARVGLVAAVLVAFANVLFVLSLAGREDPLYLFLVLLGVWLSLPILEGHAGPARLIVTGGVLGLATSAKYFGVFGLMFPLLALGGPMRTRLRHSVFVVGGFVAGLLAGIPFLLLAPGKVQRDIFQLTSQTSGVSYGVSWVEGFAYPTGHLMNSIGLPLQAAFFLAAVGLTVRARRVGLFLFLPPLAFLAALVTRPGNQGSYYTAFVAPFAALGAGCLVDLLLDALPRGRAWTVAVGGLAIAVLVAPNLGADLRYVRYLRLPDTRDAARAWIERHVPAGAAILVETRATDFAIRRGPALAETAATLERELSEIRRQGGSGRFWSFKILHAQRPGPAPRYELFKAHTVRLALLEAAPWEVAVLNAGPDADRETQRRLDERHVLLATFRSAADFPGDVVANIGELARVPLRASEPAAFRGPTLTVWKRNG